MKKRILTTFLFFLCVSFLTAQYQDRYWIMGRANAPFNTSNVSFDFYPNDLSLYDLSGPPPVWNNPPNNIDGENSFEGWGVVTDPETGELLFYTDGEDVFDANHQDITPPGGLGASASSAQAVAISINPVCPFDQYYIFSNPTGTFTDLSTSGPVTYRTYTIGGGFSPITPLPGPVGTEAVGEGMVLIPSKTDPFTFWFIVRLLVPTSNGSNYAVYRIDPTGISHHDTFTFGPSITADPFSPIMNITYVNDGITDNVIVGFSANGSPHQVFINRFNTTSGDFENEATILHSFTQKILYDLEFSPDGKFLYFATYFPSVLYQVAVNGRSPAVEMRFFGNLRAGGLKRGPDGYIYHVYNAGTINNAGTVRIGRLVKPNLAFTGDNFDDMYQADFNSSVSMVYEQAFAYNFPEFAGAPSWSAELSVEEEELLCEGSEVQLIANDNTLGQVVQNYQWLFNGGDLATTTDSFLSVNQAGQYQVLVTIEGGCVIASNQISLEAASNPPQIDNVIANEASCGTNDGLIIIEASAGEGILTYLLDGNASNTGNTFSNLLPGTYTISVQDEQGCTVSQEVEIIQTEPGPDIETLDLVAPTCLENDGILIIQASGGTGTLEYALNNTDYQLSNQFTDLTEGSYTVFVRDENDCLSSSTVELVQVENGPQIIEINSQPASCLEDDGSISISASTNNGSLVYALNDGNFNSLGTFSGLGEGTYDLIIQDELGCITIEEVTISLASNLPQIQSIQFDNPCCSASNGTISIRAQSENPPLSYSLDGLNFQNAPVFHQLPADGYTLYLQDALGCSMDTSVVLQEKNCPVYVPNSFSPNGDGVNDRFQVFSNYDPTTVIKKYSIYDRWGELIYTARNFTLSDSNLFWDGNYNSQKMNAGVFVYVIEVEYGDGKSVLLTGDVLLLL
ncbi:MAG: gliding motility-associated C-terminal domain-containing protein [Bacteroidota bacterium]